MKLSILFCAAVLSIPHISYGRAILPSSLDCSQFGTYCDEILDTDHRTHTTSQTPNIKSAAFLEKRLPQRGFRRPSPVAGPSRGSSGSSNSGSRTGTPGNPGGFQPGTPGNPGGFQPGTPGNPGGFQPGTPGNPGGFRPGTPGNLGGSNSDAGTDNKPGSDKPTANDSSRGSVKTPITPGPDTNPSTDKKPIADEAIPEASVPAPQIPGQRARQRHGQPQTESKLPESTVCLSRRDGDGDPYRRCRADNEPLVSGITPERLKIAKDLKAKFQADKIGHKDITSDDFIMVALDSGRTALERVRNDISRGTPDLRPKNTYETVSERYSLPADGNVPKTLEGRVNQDNIGADIKDELDKLGVSMGMKDKLSTVEVTSVGWRNRQNEFVANSFMQKGMYSPETGSIFGQEAFREKDLYKHNPDMRINVSDLRWAAWTKVCSDKNIDPSNLSRFFMHNIVGRSGDEVAEALLNKYRVPNRGGIQRLTPDDGDDFLAVLGTDNMKGVIHMLADKHNALNNKQPTAVYIERRPDGAVNMGLAIG